MIYNNNKIRKFSSLLLLQLLFLTTTNSYLSFMSLLSRQLFLSKATRNTIIFTSSQLLFLVSSATTANGDDNNNNNNNKLNNNNKNSIPSSTTTSESYLINSIGSMTAETPSSTTMATTASSTDANSNPNPADYFDPLYPGTAWERLLNVHNRVQQLVDTNALIDHDWETIRRSILWAGGLRDLTNARPGQGYTGHSFNDYNHVDLTCMLESISDNKNDGSVHSGIAIGNHLGTGIRVASLPDLGQGGSWSTCALGCNTVPPTDVAHIQFRSKIAFKLVWIPYKEYTEFVLLNDDGDMLGHGKPNSTVGLPSLYDRQKNYELVRNSKYSVAVDRIVQHSNMAVE